MAKSDHPNAPKNGARNPQRNEPARAPSVESASRLSELYGITAEQVEVVRKVLCPSATDEELHLFLGVCKRTQLDPFTNQIWFVKRRQKITDSFGNERWDEVARPMTGIDGYRVIAQRTGEYEGQTAPQWFRREDGKWHDVWVYNEFPAAARVAVYRRGFREPMVGIAHWDEYVPTYTKNGEPHVAPKWEQSPASQLAKCAEAHALRRAFPNDLSGLYTDTEMERFTEQTYSAPAQAPAPPPKVIDAPAQPALSEGDADQLAKVIDAFRLSVDVVESRAELQEIQKGHLQGYIDTKDDPKSAAILDRARPIYNEALARVRKLEADRAKSAKETA